MFKFVCCFAALTLIASGTVLVAQPPSPPSGGNRRGGGDLVAASVSRMMAFDADEDGKLTKSEVTDPRLEPLFERADADQDGAVTKDELTRLFTREAASLRSGGPGGPGGPPPGGPDGGGRFGPPGAGPGGRPRPEQVLPRFLQDELQLTRRQRAQLDKLQADVDERLTKILTAEQLQQLAELRDRGPGGPPPGGPDGFGPPREGREPPPREN